MVIPRQYAHLRTMARGIAGHESLDQLRGNYSVLLTDQMHLLHLGQT